jgi:hypothetical protein
MSIPLPAISPQGSVANQIVSVRSIFCGQSVGRRD